MRDSGGDTERRTYRETADRQEDRHGTKQTAGQAGRQPHRQIGQMQLGFFF